MKRTIFAKIYKFVLKPVFFQIDPETTHDLMTVFGKLLGSNIITRRIIKFLFYYSNPALEQNLAGINFKNPVGLAAGFDKNAELTNVLPSVGFGFLEVGSITGEECEGNAKPRLWRLKKSKALIVNYGLKNDGAEKVSQRLKSKKFSAPVGISVAKTNNAETVETQKGIEDYVKAAKAFRNIGGYITVNISCPNTFGGEPFLEPGKLRILLEKVEDLKLQKPIFIKLAPDLSEKELEELIDVTEVFKIDGYICSNLSKDRTSKKIMEKNISEKGGISGKVAEDNSNSQISYVYKKTGGKKIIIGCGGIFSAEDAYKKIKLGASLVQLITGMIFVGPQLIGEINSGLIELLKKDGFKNISEAVGRGVE